MARKLRWTLDFQSRLKKDCRIEIYKEGYTGTTVTELTGADVPFEYEEDKERDLLHFVRYKTGYLRVREFVFGELDELQPQTIMEHYVVAKYDNTIVFTGYIQCQEMSTAWEAAPRILEFPVISPLGLADSFNFAEPQNGGKPTLTTIGVLMQEIMSTLNPFVDGDDTQPGWQGVDYPFIGHAYYPWDGKIHTTAVCPFNKSFTYNSPDSDIYDPVSYMDFLEGLCMAKGMTIHDCPGYLLFAIYDHTSTYFYISYNELATCQNQTRIYEGIIRTLLGYWDYIDNSADASVFLPLKSLTLRNGNDIIKPELETMFASANPNLTYPFKYAAAGNKIAKGILLTPKSPVVESDVFVNYSEWVLHANNVYDHILLEPFGVFRLDYGVVENTSRSISFTPSWIYRHTADYAQAFMKFNVFHFLPHNSNGWCLLKMSIAKGKDYIDRMKSSGWSDDISLDILITGLTTAISARLTFDKDTGEMGIGSSQVSLSTDDDIDGFAFLVTPLKNGPITLQISHYSGLAEGDLLQISSISFVNPDTSRDQYDSVMTDTEIVLKGSSKGVDDVSLDIQFNDWSSFSIGEKTFGVASDNPTFAYMFKPQEFVTARFEKKQTQGENVLIPRYSYMGKNYKIIADSFDLADDTHRFTLAHTDGL